MRLRTKLVSAGAAVGMLASYSMVALPGVGAADDDSKTVPLTCLGADEDTQALIDAGLDGSLALEIVVKPDAANSETIPEGDTEEVNFDVEMKLSDELVGMAIGVLGVTELDVADLDLGIVASGGGTGGPYAAAPSDFTIQLAPDVVVPPIAAGGDVTIGDDAVATLFSVDNPMTFKVIAHMEDGGDGEPLDMILSLTCDAQEGFFFGPINGVAPEPPSTTTTTSTTTPPDTTPQTNNASVAMSCAYTVSPAKFDATTRKLAGDPLLMSLEVKATTPKQLGAGESGPVSFDVYMGSSAAQLKQAASVKVDTINMSGLSIGIIATGGGTGGPFFATWDGGTSYTVNVASPGQHVGTAKGTVTVTDPNVPIVFKVVNPVKFTTSMFTPVFNETISTVNTCTPADVAVAAINGEIPAGAANANPVGARFAG